MVSCSMQLIEMLMSRGIRECALCQEESESRGGQTFPKSTEFRNFVAFCPFFVVRFHAFQSVLAESVSEQLLQLP